jgi:tetrapyrrole methylase family protein/MazG family protein
MSTPATEPDITIVGLGPAGLDWLSGESLRRIMSSERLILRTERHPAAQELKARGVQYEPLDAQYDLCKDFSKLYPQLAEAVLAKCEPGPVTYAVPGHPLLGEESVRLVLERARERGKTVRVLPGMSFVDVVAPALAAAGETPDLREWQVADGTGLERVWWDVTRPVLVFQIDDEEVASRVKLAALEEYPPDHDVCIVRHAGVNGAETVRRMPLSDMDHHTAGRYDHLTTLYLPPLPADLKRPGFHEFVELVATLRSPEGCPWDREQTPQSLKRFVRRQRRSGAAVR